MSNYFESVIARLAQNNVEFIVVGGISGVLQGAAIVTFDLDVCYRRTPENLARLVVALSPLQPHPRGFPEGLPFSFDVRTLQMGANFTFDLGGEDFDLLGEMSGIGGYEEVISNAVEIELAGNKVKVLSLEDLIRTKETAGRPKDLAALPVLRATLAMQRDLGNT